MATYNDAITESITVECNVIGKSRTNLAKRYFLSAQQFRDKCREVETAHLGQPFDNFYMEIETLVIATIFFSVAALDANVNELFHDTEQLYKHIGSTECQEKYDKTRGGFLEIYKALAKLHTKNIPNNTVFNNAISLQELRNALIHFYPEFDDEKQAHLELEKLLKGKFKLSPFFNEKCEFFPKKCMSYGCADWSVKTAEQFITDFSKLINTPNVLE